MMETGRGIVFQSFPNVEVKKRKKSRGKNPFYYFMMDKQAEWLAEGRKYSMEELAVECKPHWDLLKTNPKLVEPYWTKVKMMKEKDGEEKLDNMGRPLRALKEEAERRQRLWLEKEAEVRQIVQGSSSSQLMRKSFFVAHFNYLCEVQGGFPPCELGIVKFSLEKGVEDSFHQFVSPLDSVPAGYQFQCIKSARDSHCLTPDFPLYNQNMKDLLAQISRFLSVEPEGGKLPLLFVGKHNLEAAEYIANFIVEKAGSSSQLRVFPITKLMQELILHQDTALAESLMERDPYSYHPGLGCGLHEGLDRSYFCSLSISKRMVFTLLSVSARCRHFELRDGKHRPSKNPEAVEVMDVDIAKLKLAYDDRINRKIPNPAGIGNICEPSELKQNQEPWGTVVKEDIDQDEEGNVVKKFPSTDIREKFRVLNVKPKLVKTIQK